LLDGEGRSSRLPKATKLAKQQGLDRWVTLQESHAEALPVAANSVDVALACTVLEEGDADLMLGELMRVTKSGGHICIIVRATDMRLWVNVSLNPSLKSKVDRPGIGVTVVSARIVGRFVLRFAAPFRWFLGYVSRKGLAAIPDLSV
jgi:ubiquinone/menaquinone biosynthesis C-methylase UbiE